MPDRSELPPHVKELFDSLTAKPEVMYCRHCGTKNLQVETTFFSLGEKFWTVPLLVIPGPCWPSLCGDDVAPMHGSSSWPPFYLSAIFMIRSSCG
jgi:hypothetical protein